MRGDAPWDDHPREACGVVGAISDRPVATEIFYALRILQHRGQESAGVAVHNGGIKHVTGMGLVHEVLDKETLSSLDGTVGIGHVRYSTTGGSKIENAQPIVVQAALGDIAVAHNGDIVNADEIKEELKKKGWSFFTTTDSEVIVRLLANEIAAKGDVTRAIRDFTSHLRGAYSLVVLVGDRLFAIRDPLGVRPLVYGEGDGFRMVASESVVFDTLGLQFVRDLKPGEILELRLDGVESHRTSHPSNAAHCMFEWVYFARPDSELEGRLVYDVRRRIGEILAKEAPADVDIVVPIPDSGRAQAFGFSQVSGQPLVEGLMKNRYIERTFIMPDPTDRELSVLLKLNPVKSAVKGKRVVLIDDSIVRGTTIRKIIKILRDAGASEVHVRIGCPPIRAPCFLGIDMKTRDQFVANGRTVPEVAAEIGADSLGYLSIRGLVEALDLPESDLCLGCLTAEYPVLIPGEHVRPQQKLESFDVAPRQRAEAPSISK